MGTARDFLILALKEAGAIGVGQTPNAEDINDSMTLLTRMIAQWQKRRWLIPSLMDVVAIGNNRISNPIGAGQYYNAPRPDKIRAAYIVQRNTGQNPVSYPLYPIWSYEDYSRITLKQLNTLPCRFFYDAAYPNGNVFVWPIPNETWEVHLIIPSALGFATTIDEGLIINGGAGYVDGPYLAVPVIGGSGSSATANVTVTGGVVTQFEIQNGGEGYNIGDSLSISAANLGGTGNGFSYTVNRVSVDLDSELIFPPEYEEAIHYNLAIRLTSAFQVAVNPQTVALAKVSLNTIKVANTQVPTLVMPAGLRRNGAFNIYNPDGYGNNG